MLLLKDFFLCLISLVYRAMRMKGGKTLKKVKCKGRGKNKMKLEIETEELYKSREKKKEGETEGERQIEGIKCKEKVKRTNKQQDKKYIETRQ